MSGWSEYTLQELLDMSWIVSHLDGNHGSDYPRKAEFVDEGVPYLSAKCMKNGSVDFSKAKFLTPARASKLRKGIAQDDDVLFAHNATVGPVAVLKTSEPKVILGTSLTYYRCDQERILPGYLVLYMQSKQFTEQYKLIMRQSTRNQVPITKQRTFTHVIPPLAEQKRIVSILDEAFSAIAKAKENAEKNLLSARELFESYLNRVFTQQGPGWQEKKLDDLSQINSGGTPLKSTKEFWDGGDIPWYSSGELNDLYTKDSKKFITEAGLNGSNAKLFPVGSLLMGMYDTAALKMSLLDREGTFNQAVAGMRPNDDIDFRFLLFAVRHVRPEVLKLRRGVRQKNLSLAKIKAITIRLPKTKVEQTKVVEQILRTEVKTKRLETIYTQKLANLDELKQSLLQKAFTGKLTNSESVSFSQHTSPFPVSIAGISTTDLHAGILGLAYLMHKQPKTKHFGHVKGEKVAHLVEYLNGIDLGRTPIKDAAGPNDFQHLKKVESRAKKAGFFAVARQDDRYILTPKNKFEDLLGKTKSCLADRLNEVESLLEVMAKLTTRQAEIFATTFAAWNNLLILGQPCDDDSIVLEARENWHPKKLKIEREKFVKSVAWMRENGFTPKGLGKLVGPKPEKVKLR